MQRLFENKDNYRNKEKTELMVIAHKSTVRLLLWKFTAIITKH